MTNNYIIKIFPEDKNNQEYDFFRMRNVNYSKICDFLEQVALHSAWKDYDKIEIWKADKACYETQGVIPQVTNWLSNYRKTAELIAK